jgi:hypothetical protein
MRIYYHILIIMLFFIGILFFTLSFLPFKTVSSFVESLCNEGRVNFINDNFYCALIYRLRLLSLFVLMIVMAIVIYRVSIERYLLTVLKEIINSYQDLKNYSLFNIDLLVKNHKIELLSFGFILMVGIFLRIYYLFAAIRIDEAGVFIFIASKSLIACIFSYPFPGDHVFYTIMVNILHNILGDNVWVMRLPALLAGILMIPASYLLFRATSNNLAALLTSALVAVSSPLIEYSTNARGYTTITLIFIIELLLIYYLSKNRNLFGWSIFILLSAIGFYTIPVYILPFGIVVLWYILLVRYNSSKYTYLKDVGIAVIIVGLLTYMLYLPIIIVYGNGVLLDNEYVQSVPLLLFIKRLIPMVGYAWDFWNQDVQSMIMYLIAFGFLIFITMIKYANKELRTLLISSVLFIIIMLFIKRVNPWPRIWLFLIPIYFGLACTGLSYVIEKINRQRLALSIIMSIFFLTAIGSTIIMNDTIFNSDTGGKLLVDGDQITKYIKDNIRLKDDKVFVVNLTYRTPMIYYFKKYKLPLNHLLAYNSMESDEFKNGLKKIIAIEVNHVLKERKEIVLQDAKVNIDDFQSPVLLKKFAGSSLYLYQRE